MALYSREQTKSFFSEIANEQDICVYCEKAIAQKRADGEIDRDEMHRQLRLLKGKLTSKRVMKLRYVGHDFCICPQCVSKINAEINPEPSKPNMALDYSSTIVKDSVKETVVEPVTETEKPETKSKGKGKANASK